MELFIEVIKFNIYISPLILFFILFTKKISKYTFKFNYFICLLIVVRMMFISKINLNILNINNTTINIYKHNIDNYIPYDQGITLDIFMYIWILGIIAISFYYLRTNFKFYNYIENFKKEILEIDITSILDEQAKELSINKKLQIYKVKGIYSPAIIGLTRCKIIIPEKKYNNK
ncbi:TPA: protease, partial [Clostridioides difficile]|nr:protease [Clostridioides difficile]